MSNFNYSFELHELSEALTPYGFLETDAPEETTHTIDNFTDGAHFRTAPNDNKELILSLENRLLNIIIDESGSMTWNDRNRDRFIYIKRLLSKLNSTYPGEISGNLVTFGGSLTKTNLFVAQAGTGFLTSDSQDFNSFLQQTFQDSVYDFAGVRVVRRFDRFPEHPSDGIVVTEGITEAAKDENLEEGRKYYYGVWTFNKNLHFSNGQFVSGVPFDRDLPQGVNNATATTRILPGITRDENTQIIYNFVEGDGFIAFDSSGFGRHGILGTEVVEDNFWLGDAASGSYGQGGDLKKSVGVRFDGEFDIVETNVDESIGIVGSQSAGGPQPITVNIWLFRYNQSDAGSNGIWIAGTSTEEPTNTIGWAIGLTSSGNLSFQVRNLDSGLQDTGIAIPEKEWTMVTLRFGREDKDEIDVFKNGTYQSTYVMSSTIDTTAMDRLYLGAKPVTSAAGWQGVDYFGSVAQFSVSNTDRSDSYISDLYSAELDIFDQSSQKSTQSPADNSQREVLLQWEVGDDFNYEGGNVKIIRKYLKVPSHETDGEEVVVRSATPGTFFYIDAFDFINNEQYYYRVFTVNAIGNICDRTEARTLPAPIPASLNSPPSPALSTVSNEQITNGNKKILIEWSNPTDERWVGTKIYYGISGFPTVSISSQGDLRVSDGQLIVDSVDEVFVHRHKGENEYAVREGLNNGEFHYYSLITYDRLGNISEPRFLVGIPTAQSSLVFTPEEVEDLHIQVVNPETLSLQWNNPTVRSDKLELFFGETSLVFVSVKDIFGGNLDDVSNLKLQVCTSFTERGLQTSEKPIGINSDGDSLGECFGAGRHHVINGGCENGSDFEENCNSPQEEAETVLTFATVQSGLIKGLLTHTSDKFILARRERYDMAVRGQYKVEDTEIAESLFEFNTEAIQVAFNHPITISLINKLNKRISVPCNVDGGIRGDSACPGENQCGLGDDDPSCKTEGFNGGFVGASIPYIVRAEFQFKGESLPDGSPVTVQLFKHGDGFPLDRKSDRTSIREGVYQTSAVLEEALDPFGQPTGELVSKSIVDIEVPHPLLADHVDVYVSLEHQGFLVDGVHDIRFISSLFIQTDIAGPSSDGIDVAEQFATVWSIDPDFPDDPDKVVIPPDGTLVKWELLKLRFAKDRPFYSTEPVGELISGVYSTTISGVARNVFFGPVGNVDSHKISICQGTEECCVGEEYAIKASVIVGEDSANDAAYVVFPCQEEKEFSNKRFLMNAAENQPGQNPHWITWADGESLLEFNIAKNPALSQIMGADCFRQCVESQVGGQLFPFPDDHIVQISADAEILWNVTFDEDPYTGQRIPISFDSAKPTIENNVITQSSLANIPIVGETTEFFLRLNKFVGKEGNPKPADCNSGGGGGGQGSGGVGNDSCKWHNVCDGINICSPTSGEKWINVSTVNGQSTLIAENKALTLLGGGGYETGMPPILSGFKEPLDVRIIEARVSGERINELVVDSTSRHTFVVDVTFAGCPVPDGTKVELFVEGPDADIIILSSCQGVPENCNAGSSGIIYTNLVNDPLINPPGETSPGPCGTFNKKSLAYFTIEPLPNVAFNATINVICRYDKLGEVNREVVNCIELNNTINVSQPDEPNIPGQDPIATTVSSNETLIYDTVQDLFEKTRAGQVMRLAHFNESVTKGTGDFIYMFGGFTEHDINAKKGITPTGEFFNVSTQEWLFTTDMPTPRMAGMTVTHNENIYCVGGIEINNLTDQYRVSRKIEVFDTETELWNTTLTPMPEDYGVAFGDAQVVGDFIYVVCGVTSIINNTSPGDLNKRILRYSIPNDSWDIIKPNDELFYNRIAPFAFYRNPITPPDTTNLNIAVQNINDDSTYNISSENWNPDGTYLQVSSDRKFYIRFPINIPKGAIILDAFMDVKIDEGDVGDTHASIYLLDSDNAIDLWTATENASNSPQVTPPINWSNIEPTSGDERAHTSSFTSLVQKFINRPGYEVGNYIGLEFADNGSVGRKRIHAFETGGPDGDEPVLNIKYTLSNAYYVYGGSIPKTREQISSEYIEQLNKKLDSFRAFILTSPYYQSLTRSEQISFVEQEEQKIRDDIVIPPFIYPSTGFLFRPMSETFQNNELVMDVSDSLEDKWTVLPKPRDRGATVYIPQQDIAYFMGGSNQNQSTTLNRMESIDLSNDNTYTKLTPFPRGRALFGAVQSLDDIYTTGGLTSGHKEGYVEIEIEQVPEFVEALGKQSSGLVVRLRNDSGELIEDEIRCIVRGRLRLEQLDSIIVNFLAERGADRALGGDGGGTAPDLPEPGDSIDFEKLLRAQNKIIDPNSDQFQFNAARKLAEQIFLFPILYSEYEFVIQDGVAGVTMLPRSEDPLADFQKIAEFIKSRLESTPEDPDERFEGDLTREELAALGDALSVVRLPPTIIDAGTFRELYQIETTVTIVDSFYFGQTTSDFDFEIQRRINSRIRELLTPPDLCEGIQCDEGEQCDPETGECVADDGSTGGGGSVPDSGSVVIETDCFLLQHLADPEIPPPDNPPPDDPNSDEPGSTGGFGQSGQCLFCDALIPLVPQAKPQLPTRLATFWNSTDWVPQIRKRLVNGNHTLEDVLAEIDIIDFETPFGGSQLYNAIIQSGRIMAGESFEDVKKVVYVLSDNSQNLSLSTRQAAIDEINAVDGDKNTPVVYTVFSTAFPLSISSQFERTEVGDVEKITQDTGGQSSTLTSSAFIDQILNLTLGGATGGLGYGVYRRVVDLGDISAVTKLEIDFDLPSNTQGFIRFRHSTDGFNFTDFSERFEGSGLVDFVDFFARLIEIEVILTTGFTEDITEEYDGTPTGVPKLIKITWTVSGEKEDFLFINPETVLTNAQQIAVAFEGSVPKSSIIEVGVASSLSHNWKDFQSQQRPALIEFGKTFMLDRTTDPISVVPAEPLTSRDGLTYIATSGPWDPASAIFIFRTTPTGEETQILEGFKSNPRDGQIIFDERQPLDDAITIQVVNDDVARVGLRLRNRLHTDSIKVEGVGYVYNTNDVKPVELSQVAPRALNVFISPQVPTASDTIIALYDFQDLNNDSESGTIISWFKNGKQLFEIQNKTNWTNENLNNNNKLIPNDKLSFSVTPSDGKDFGPTAFSPVINVAARPPGAEGVKIVPIRNGVSNNRFDTGSTFIADYSFNVEDQGENSFEEGTVIRWFVNGIVFKEGTFSASDEDPYNDPRELSPLDTFQGATAHSIGNQIFVEITPKTRLITGNTVNSNTIIVVNSIGRVNSATIAPENPTQLSTLSLTYDLDDPDIDLLVQTDQSEIKWFNSVNGIDFLEVEELAGQLQVSPNNLSPGQSWQAQVQPFDGLDLGEPIKSNVVTIQA